MPRGRIYGPPGQIGTVHVPEHPLMEEVRTINATGLTGDIATVNPGATRIVDWNSGRVLGAARTNPMVPNGARSVALNFFPIVGYTSGDYAQMIVNAIRWTSRQPDFAWKSMPFDLDPIGYVFRDDDPNTTTHQDALPVRVEVRDDDHGKLKPGGGPIGGLGNVSGPANITNVDAVITGGFDSAERDPDGNVSFYGFRIADPALFESTEWFAYAWDFGDGTPVEWEYVGNLTPPKFEVLLLHTLCLSGNSCANYTALRDTLQGLDDVASVDGHNFMNYPGNPQAPALGVLLSHDVVVVAMNWGYASYRPWDVVRRLVGNRLAEYLDADAGGVVTLMTAFDSSPQLGDGFTLSGRYVVDDYGPFEKSTFGANGSTLGTLLDPDHDLFVDVHASDVESSRVHSGNYSVTIGGNGEAAGRNGTVLARWSDGNSAIGVKTLNNGRRTVHLGLSWSIVGGDTPQLLRNAIGWAAGGIPTPLLMPITHQFGNSPPYTVDLMIIDDDMGWEWDFLNQVPIEIIAPAVISHRYITIT